MVGDTRVLHAAHPDRSDQGRTVLTPWCQHHYQANENQSNTRTSRMQHSGPRWSKWSAEIGTSYPIYSRTAADSPQPSVRAYALGDSSYGDQCRSGSKGYIGRRRWRKSKRVMSAAVLPGVSTRMIEGQTSR